MGKSYRRPYAAITGVYTASHRDKTIASRSFRRAQDRYLREFNGDWDSFLIPERYEASDNDVWGWGRDGKQHYQCAGCNTFNPYAYTYRVIRWVDEDAEIAESIRDHEQWMAYITRK